MSDTPASTVTAAPSAPRPRSVTAAAVALALAGICAVVAALTLFGLHSWLISSTTKAQPKKLAITQIAPLAQQAHDQVSADLAKVSGPLSPAQITAEANALQKYLTAQFPTANMASSEIDDQASKGAAAVTTALTGLGSTPVSAPQVASVSKQVQDAVSKNLTDLQKKQKTPLSAAEITKQVNRTPTTQLIASLVVLAALGFISYSTWRGRYWVRWGVLIIWVLCTFTGTLAGLNSILMIFGNIPAAFKLPAGLAGISLAAAVVLAMLRPSVEYFALSRPAPAPGAPARRGLFAPRTPVGGAGTRPSRTTANRPARPASAGGTDERADARQRAKKRADANAESVRIGAEMARSRAKASKSRRTGG